MTCGSNLMASWETVWYLWRRGCGNQHKGSSRTFRPRAPPQRRRRIPSMVAPSLWGFLIYLRRYTLPKSHSHQLAEEKCTLIKLLLSSRNPTRFQPSLASSLSTALGAKKERRREITRVTWSIGIPSLPDKSIAFKESKTSGTFTR